MNTADTGSIGTASRPAVLYGVFVAGLGICLAGNLAVRLLAEAISPPDWLLAVIAVATALPLVVAAVFFWRMMRRTLDEMLQRIVLEGLAFALTVYIPLAALYVNWRTAGGWAPALDPPDILMTPAILVAAGIAFAWRRYR